MLFDVLLLLGLFSGATSVKDKKSSSSAKRSSSLILLLSIVLKEPLNPLLRLFNIYGKLKKWEPSAALTFQGLGNSAYITDQSESQGTFALSRNNANNTKNSWYYHQCRTKCKKA